MSLRDRLRAELRSLNREAWAAEECAGLAQIPPSSARQPSEALDIKGARLLGRRERDVLAELVRFRENLARRKDLAPFMVLDNTGLMALAREHPRDREALERIKGLSRRVRQQHAAEILEAIRRGETAAEPRPPRPPRRRLPRPPPGTGIRVDRLKAWRAGASAEAGLDPGLLLPQWLIDRIAVEGPEALETLAAIPGIRRWRIESFGPAILAALRH